MVSVTPFPFSTLFLFLKPFVYLLFCILFLLFRGYLLVSNVERKMVTLMDNNDMVLGVGRV